jgi:hypothetical protein
LEKNIMASFAKVNPVADGNAVVTGLRPLAFFEVDTANTGLLAANGPDGAVTQLIQVIETQSTIEVWGQIGTLNLVGNAGGASTANAAVRFALADLNTTNAATLQTAIRAIGVSNDGKVNFAGANVYSFTF